MKYYKAGFIRDIVIFIKFNPQILQNKNFHENLNANVCL